MNKDSSSSYLTFEQSSAIKGFLMLLIMLGHNHIIAPNGGELFKYLYQFHIFGFFILPFLYNKKLTLNTTIVLNNFIKIWIPYIVFYLICYFTFHLLILKNGFDITELLYGIILANEKNIKQITGFGFVWFLPAYFSMFLYMMLFARQTIYIYLLIFVIGFLLNINIGFTRNHLYTSIPFALTQGFLYFTYGFLTKILLDNIPKIHLIGAFTFLIISILFWTTNFNGIRYIFPISGFLFIYSFANILSRISLLVEIGKYSLPIYLIHVFIYNILEKILPKDILFGYIIFFLTLFISLFISYWIIKIDLIRKLVLPKDWNDYKSLIKY